MLDQHAAELFEKNINMMVPYYLMASYAYYENDSPIFSDAFFDSMGKTMIECWDDIEHRHKEHLTIDMLTAGTYMGEYPSIVKDALISLCDSQQSKRKKKKTK